MYVIKSVICSLFIFACSSLLAQDKYGAGFYINSQKDTVRGFIKYSDDYSDTFVFKKDLSAGAEKLTIAQSSFYGFYGGNYYSAINFSADQTTANRVYARQLIDGSIDLYAYYNKFLIGSEKRSYFLMTKSKGGNTSDQLARLQGNQGAFNVLFADCLEVAQDAGKNGINEDKLVNLVDRYHACKGLKMGRYLPERRKSVSLSIYAGMTFANLSFNGEEESLNVTAFGTSVNPTLGVMVLLTPRGKTFIYLRFATGAFI